MSEFLAMGGYAAFVWPAYGIFFLVLAINWWSARRSRIRALRNARKRIARQRK